MQVTIVCRSCGDHPSVNQSSAFGKSGHLSGKIWSFLGNLMTNFTKMLLALNKVSYKGN